VYIKGDTPPVRGKAHGEYHLRPFIELDKTQIMNIYIKENILDLLELTNSCGALINGKTQCGGCYFCMERSWAAKNLNLIDNPLPIEE
jgi:7-cyano-7-deazaguanine synthase in queuosine biosynthesis